VPAIGEETVIDGVMDRKGHTRCMIDAQRIDNYWSSAAVEFVALQGKSPFIATAQAIGNRGRMWDTANTTNYSVLIYEGVDERGQQIPPPQRAPPPVMPQAYIDGLRMARDDLMQVSGQHQAELGIPGNERSGKAIDARQRQSEQSVAHYVDNQAKMIRQVGRILIDLIPKVYDTARVTKIMAEDGTESDVHIIPNADTAHQHMAMTDEGPKPISPEQAKGIDEDDNDQTEVKLIFNPNVGKYDVEADVGPQYGTLRQEAANAFSQIMAQNPSAFQLVGDFWAQNSDFPGADQLAARLRRGLPPQFKPGPDPQVEKVTQAAQQMHAQAQQMLQQADAEIASLKAQLVHQKGLLDDKGHDLAIKDYDAETKRLTAVGGLDPLSLQIVVRQMVQDMLQTELHPMLQRHADIEAGLQAQMAPPAPDGATGPANGQAGPMQ
jgi:Phage P22-like portal protein